MTKPKLPRMQHLAREIFCKPRRVDFIAEHGMAEMMKMHANLMSTPAMQPAFNQTCLIARANDAIFRFGGAPTL